MYRFQKFARKHKPALATAVAIALCLILGTTVSAWQAVRATTAEAHANANEQKANTQRDEAQKQRDEVKTVNERLNRTLYAAHMSMAQRAWEEAAMPRLQNLLDQHRPQAGEPDLRSFEWHYLARLAQVDAPLTLKERNYFFTGAEFSPEGKRLLTIASSGGSSGVRVEAELKLWDSATGQELQKFKGGNSYVIFSSDGNRLVSRANDNTVKVWDTQTGEELLAFKHSDVRNVAISADGKRLATASTNTPNGGPPGTLMVWDAFTGQELRSEKGDFRGLAFSPDGKRLAYGVVGSSVVGKADPGTVKVSDVESGEQIFSLPGAASRIRFSPSGKRLAASSVGGRVDSARIQEEVKVWDAQTGQELKSLNEKSDAAIRFAFSPDGKRIAIAGHRSLTPRIKVCDLETGEEHFNFQRHTDEITDLHFSRDSNCLASGSADRTVRIWDLRTGREIQMLKGHTDGVSSVAFSPDGKRLVSTAWDGRVKVWDVQGASDPLAPKMGRVAISADFKRLATASIDNVVRLWDVTSGKETMTLKGHTSQVQSMAFSPDGNRVASCDGTRPGLAVRSKDALPPGVVKVWDTQTGQELFTCQGHVGQIIFVAFSPDGKKLASRGVGGVGGGQPVVKVWDAQSGQELLSLQPHQPSQSRGPYDTVAFSPDGKRLASGGEEVKVWDAESGRELLSLKTGGRCVAFIPDGKRLASVAPGGIAWIGDAQSGQEEVTFSTGHMEHVLSLAFSQDGKRLATADRNGTIKVWDAQVGQEMLTFGHTATLGSAAYGADRHSHSLAFSSDGQRLASAMWDGSVRVWDATPLPEKP